MLINKKYNTKPLILHNPFLEFTSEIWNISLLNSYKVNCSVPDDLTIVTYNNNSKKGILERQLSHIGVPYICLGKKLKWESNRKKLKLFLDNFDLFKTKYILSLDCYDVIVIRDIKHIIEMFLKTGSKVLFNATGTNYPNYKYFEKKEQDMCPNAPFQFLNSGVYIGEKYYIKNMIEQSIKLENYDEFVYYKSKMNTHSDQWLMKKMYHNDNNIKIDWKCELFQIAYLKHEEMPTSSEINPCDYDILKYIDFDPEYKHNSFYL